MVRYDQGNLVASLPRETRVGPIDRPGRPILVGAIRRQHQPGPGRVIGRTATRSGGRSLLEDPGSSVTATRRVVIGLHAANSTVTHRRANDDQRHLRGRAAPADQGDRVVPQGHDAAREVLRVDPVHHDQSGQSDQSDREDRAVQMM